MPGRIGRERSITPSETYLPRGSLLSAALMSAFALALNFAFWASVWGSMGVIPSRLAPGCVLAGEFPGIGLAAPDATMATAARSGRSDSIGPQVRPLFAEEQALRR